MGSTVPQPDATVLGWRVGLCVVAVIVLGWCGLGLFFFPIGPDVDVNTFYPEVGMTSDELIARYGPPSSKHPGIRGTTTWYYSTGWFGLGGAIGVNIDVDGRVESSFNL